MSLHMKPNPDAFWHLASDLAMVIENHRTDHDDHRPTAEIVAELRADIDADEVDYWAQTGTVSAELATAYRRVVEADENDISSPALHNYAETIAIGDVRSYYGDETDPGDPPDEDDKTDDEAPERAQGRTVDSAHVVLSPGADASEVYVGQSQGRRDQQQVDGVEVVEVVEHADARAACAAAASAAAAAAARANARGDSAVGVVVLEEVADHERPPCDQDGGF